MPLPSWEAVVAVACMGQAPHSSLSSSGLTRNTASAGRKASKKGILGWGKEISMDRSGKVVGDKPCTHSPAGKAVGEAVVATSQQSAHSSSLFGNGVGIK